MVMTDKRRTLQQIKEGNYISHKGGYPKIYPLPLISLFLLSRLEHRKTTMFRQSETPQSLEIGVCYL